MSGGSFEPATGRSQRGRAEPVEPSPPTRPAPPPGRTPWWVRLRSAAILGCLSVTLGLLAAVVIGVGLVVLIALLRSSLGS